jgi:hypothetical protein
MAVLACNAPSPEGLFGRGGTGSTGLAGGAGQSTGGTSSTNGGSAGSAGASVAGNGGDGGLPGSGGGTSGAPAGGGGGGGGGVYADAASLPETGLDAGLSCEGTLRDGICWYLGPDGESCVEVCDERGGFNPAAIAVIGTASQGGSIESCSALLEVLDGTANQEVVQGTQVEGFGVGCHLFDAQAGYWWWLESPDFSEGASLAGGSIVCGCNE